MNEFNIYTSNLVSDLPPDICNQNRLPFSVQYTALQHFTTFSYHTAAALHTYSRRHRIQLRVSRFTCTLWSSPSDRCWLLRMGLLTTTPAHKLPAYKAVTCLSAGNLKTQTTTVSTDTRHSTAFCRQATSIKNTEQSTTSHPPLILRVAFIHPVASTSNSVCVVALPDISMQIGSVGPKPKK